MTSWLKFLVVLNCFVLGAANEAIAVNRYNAVAGDSSVWVFIMAGQSNMAGRAKVGKEDENNNPRIITMDSNNNWVVAKEPLHFYEPSLSGLDCGISFAREMLKNVPEFVTIALVPCAVGGSSIYQWLNDEEHKGVKLLSNFESKIKIAQQKGVIKGILWHQGERNANPVDSKNYELALAKLVLKFRSVTGNAQLPIVFGEIGRYAENPDKQSYIEAVNKSMQEVAKKNSNLYVVSSEGLEHRGDNLHFNAVAQRRLGILYAEKIMYALSIKK